MSDFSAELQIVLNEIELLPNSLRVHKKSAAQAVSRLFKNAARRTANGVFVSTGDIDAMWLRDSSFQVRPLLRFCHHEKIAKFVSDVIAQQAFYIAIDPYANAFNITDNAMRWHKDFEDQSDWVFERKWEIDSLASFLDISLGLAEETQDVGHMDAAWWRATELVLETFEREQGHDPSSYRLFRPGAPDHDHLSQDGYGAPFANCGLIWSGFRPSDDACELPFNIAQNAYASAVLKRLAKVAPEILASRCKRLASDIDGAITKSATLDGKYVYEIDGLGNRLIMDDANIPSLLSLPYLGYCAVDDEHYLNTRAAVLSDSNPWFFSGSVATHIGSPHTGEARVWPLAMAMEIITSRFVELNKLDALLQLADDGNGFHESISVEDATDFTREWFSWAEMTYFDAVFTTAERLAAN